MAKSSEAIVFQNCFSLLQEGLQHELSSIVPRLFSKGLISQENRDKFLLETEPPNKRAALLLSVLESRIHIDPSSFNLIIHELDSCPPLKHHTARLRSELERIKAESESSGGEPQQGSSIEVSTEEVHGATSSLTTSCRSARVSPTVLCIQKEITSLEGQFASLVMKLICVLTMLERKSSDFIDEVRAAVLAIPLSLKNQHHTFLDKHRRKFRQASNVTKIMDSLCSYWNYLNVSLFEYMMKKFGGKEMEAEFEVYMVHLKDFRQKTKLSDFIDARGEDKTALPPEFVEVLIRMGSSWEHRTLEDAEQLRLKQCRKAEFAAYGLYFNGGRRNCIIVTWGVAEMAVSSLLSVLDDIERNEFDILAIDYNAATLVSDTLSTVEQTDITETEMVDTNKSQPDVASPKAAYEGESFGQRRPPLFVTIKTILERYPDGQIFKELIQNADDAGARTVRFFLDSRQHGTSSLVKPEIGRFQGPALLAYNDAQFTDDDWEGIQNLQQSEKAKDPFKVGKFGIGFNSVYHITDFPSIISGSKLAYLEPQEKIWEGKSGRSFEITDISDLPDTFSPFKGICGFTTSMGSFPGTLFRFPLRTTPSELSENVYSILQLHQLLEALKEEAKFLLLFLRSVDNIEVYEKNECDTSLLFKVSIQERDTVHSKRMVFIDKLKASHAKQQSYSINNIIPFLADFHVEVRDQSSPQPVLSHWLVTTEVGSTDSEVLRLASNQKTFPWVGAALELKDSPRATVSPGGRIFCFLPMPVEASSPYPVHINGTFGLNDDRRTLKWPGIERRNDPTAKWNTELVSKLLPSCYCHLMMSAKHHLKPQEFYSALPEVKLSKGSPWKDLLRPLFQLLLSQAVVWTERKEALQLVGKWIKPCNSVFIPQGEEIPSVVYDTLSCCNVQLVKLPPRFWSILNYHGMFVKKVSPNFARAQLRLHPNSYTSTGHEDKMEILRYCLSDKNYSNLQGLCLLPLADQVSFTTFVSRSHFGQTSYYLCTLTCPAFLLPNQEGILVDVLDDSDLHSSLTQVARSGKTQLKELTAADVAHLLPQSIPQECSNQQIAFLPHLKLSSDWFEKFWKWVHNESLYLFKGQLIVPAQPAGMPSGSFQVVRLNQPSPVVYIPLAVACSSQLLSALSKLKVMCSKQEDFPYLYHKELMTFLTSFDTNGVLDAIYNSSGHHSQVSLNEEEASSIKAFLSSPLPTVDGKRLQVLQSLPIFTTMANSGSQLYSVSRAASNSIVKRAIKQPNNFVLSASYIPSELYIFTNAYPQTQLLHLMQTKTLVTAYNNIDFLLNILFPLIQRGQFTHGFLDGAMEEVLEAIPAMCRQASSSKTNQLFSVLGSLPFLKTGSQGPCHCPKDLYDPSNSELQELYKGEYVFPIAPFNEKNLLKQLRECGLRQSVQPQEIINIINSIALPQSSNPQKVDSVKMSRAKAVLKHLAKLNRYQLDVCVFIPSKKGSYTFSSALQQLATSHSWLPVCSTPPENYPLCIEWKGRPYSSHFVCMSNCTVVLSSENTSTLPLIVGSQVYTVETQFPDVTAKVLNIDTASQVKHVIAHFKMLLNNFADVSNKTMSHTVKLIYKFLQSAKKRGLHSQLHPLKSLDRWIWLKNQHALVSPTSVAVKQNPTFSRSLAPFLFILPDKLAGYSDLFTAYGMARQVTKAQIISVLEQIKSSDPTQLNPGEAWDIVMSILNWLTDNGERKVSLPPESTLYVPIQSQSVIPELVEADEVVYTDNDFLKNYLASVETGESNTFVHSKVHPKLAHCLGISPLSDILDITEDTFEDTGQYEPLTVRLKNILKDYKDGLTIIKELLQNADDAEATEVNICYDARTHNVSTKALFFSGMADSHGPALVVHNNAVFSGEDFNNITKLAGATKESKPLKIGKFGIGFCSVYHITDIPSFVSNDTLCIFDPTLSYLKKEIKNPARPGKKIKFTSKFISASKQLAPYDGLYGFRSGFTCTYNGTMFRFPFRASASELSGTIYSEAVCNELVSSIHKNASKLLLFLHNVNRITFSRISQGEQTPTMLLEVTRTPEETTTLLPQIVSHTIESNDLSSDQSYLQHWLVASSMETVECKHATASVACLLSAQQPTEVEGEVFCFLPLALKTGLPVHISGNFSVMNNRRGIWTSDGESKTSFEVKWNEELMSTVVPSAYHLLLSALQTMEEQGQLDNYVFYSLWPVEQKLAVHNPWNILVSNLYSQIQESNLFHSSLKNQWLTVDESKFLDSGILSVSISNPSTPQCVLEVVEQLQFPIVYLPSDYHHANLNLSCSTITEEEFVKLFFESIDTLNEVPVRNKVLCCMFEVYATELDSNSERMDCLSSMLKTHSCVPCIPDGKMLRQCSSVVDPTAQFASLFDPQESRLPIQEFANKQLVYTALSNLGMLKKYAPWYLLIERAQSISKDYKINKTKALQRVKLILDCVETTSNNDTSKEDGTTLSEIPFLPVLHKPKGYPLPWQGDSHTLHCGNKVVLRRQKLSYCFVSSDCISIAGSQVAILNEELPTNGGCGYVSSTTLKILQVRQSPSLYEVINHLKCLITLFEAHQVIQSEEWSDRICWQAYHFLNDKLSEETTGIIAELQDYSCIWTGRFFISPKVVALKWSVENGPYLFRIPSELATKKKLIKALEIKENFTTTEIILALKKMKEDFRGQPAEESCIIVLRAMIHALDSLVETHELESLDDVALPDTSFVMHRASDLAFNDAPWYKSDGEHVFVNSMITRELALKLGVKPVRSKMLDKYASELHHFQGIKFGQREELTQRIQNILREYPFDVTVLKELLQNADDAKAQRMYIILDKRTHSEQGILSDEWRALQGPALLVWNDSTFSERDLEGIQQLGLGSKRSESESIGQYGIGFNVVYHLTDCPSFITGGDTLCIFDPHCCYVPEADHLCPGRRYNNLSTGFWYDFPGLKSAYLQDKPSGFPPELLSGSLFRFPLRNTIELMQSSKIVDHTKFRNLQPLTAEAMHRNLRNWVPEMKQALLFLNYVTELQFLVIEDKNNLITTEYQYQVNLTESAQKSRELLHDKVSAFTQPSGIEPCVQRYPLAITEVQPKRARKTEQWLIQQGVGDIGDNDDPPHWLYIDRVKPRHGIAAPLTSAKDDSLVTHHSGFTTEASISGLVASSSQKTSKKKFLGQVFCFLPLPIKCNLPVHVNGHFILDSSRRALWRATQPGHIDDRTKWNEDLLNAIASSYANLLIHAHEYYISKQPTTKGALESSISDYYNMFPQLSDSASAADTPVEHWLKLAEDVYKKLAHLNAPVLASIETSDVLHNSASVVTSKTSKYSVNWHKISCADEPSAQVYFFKTREDFKVKLRNILQNLGMNITHAPLKIRDNFEKVEVVIPATNPESVFQYYISFYQLSEGDPCDIQKTPFKMVDDFKAFIHYILRKCDTENIASIGCFEFPQEPFGHPLLLTADCKLQNFQKVIKSAFYFLFPHSQEQFLHPELLQLSLKGSYFISPEESENDNSIVNNIIIKALPHTLRKGKVQNASQSIEQRFLIMLWKCFENDDVFNAQLSNILRDWALLQTTDNRLFSCPSKDCLLPVIQPCVEDNTDSGDDVHKHVYQALQYLRMPFLASGIISSSSTANQFCPMLANHKWILKNLYHLNKEFKISPLLQLETLKTLVEYLRKINFKLEPSYKKYLLSLPLFQDIDNNMISLAEKTVHVWPHNVSPAGRRKWLQGKRVVFLQYHSESLWCRLGSFEDLGVEPIQAESVYMRYIFHEFKMLNEHERYEHLAYIRDNIFDVAEVQAQSQMHKNHFLASEFIQALKNLSCIGVDGEELRCVSEFCDHTIEIFTTFSQFFRFLPHSFQEDRQHDKWINFFVKLGLKQSLTKPEYICCCESAANGKHLDVMKSSALLQYLFPSNNSKCPTELHEDSGFLLQISQIPFVCAEQLPELSWIAPSFSSSEGRQTTLHDAADIEHSDLLWQVHPIIKLPFLATSNYPNELQKVHVIVTPSVDDVVANIVSISSTHFADSSLFNNYPLDYIKPKAPEKCKSLMQVLLKNFEFLKSHLHDLIEDHFKQLSSAYCIPVYANLSKVFNDDFVVLVKPQHVVLSSSAQDYFPFIHRLPTEILSVVTLLEKVGVSSDLDLKHFQIVLHEIYNLSNVDKMNPNMKTVATKTVKELDAMLKKRRSSPNTMSQTYIENALYPLYLPTTEGKLHLSSSLLCRDTESYTNIEITLSETELHILHLPQSTYELREVEFCSLLPKSLRPKMMSECCIQILSDDVETVKDSQLTSILKENLSQSLLVMVLTLMIKHFTKDEKLFERCKPVLARFFVGLQIRSVRKLKPTVMLKVVEPPLVVGKAVVNCHIKEHIDETSTELSIDSRLAPNQDIIALKHLVQHIISILRPLCSTAIETSLEKLSTPFLTALMAESSEQLTDALEESGITQRTEMMFEAGVKPRLGKQIPKCWHHLLDQNISNIFHSEEWVGYQEDIEGESNTVYTFAQVVCPILTEGVKVSFATVLKYKIYTKEDDEEGILVSALQIFKFVSRKESSDKDGVRIDETGKDIKEAKKDLCEELTAIWKLPDHEKKQGIRRLYLKWHPDKNFSSTAFAEEIFKFLLHQIDRLERNLPLEDLDNTHSTIPQEQTSYSQWSSYYPQWDETVHHHQQSRQSEQRYRQQAGGWSESASKSTNFGEEFVRPSPNQQEGKRWVRQAHIDYEILCVIHERVASCPEYAGHVCFMAHQVAEKALKGGKYAVCGLGANGLKFHGLTNHAYALQAERPEVLHGLSSLSAPLENYYLNTRYPNRVIPPQIPSDGYTAAEAYQAKCNAESILKMMESIV